MTPWNIYSEHGFKVLDIPEDEYKYYVAIKCLCGSALVWAGKDDFNRKKCFYCNTEWIRDDEGNVTKC